METITPFLGDESPILREVAARTLGALLAVDAPAVGDAEAAAVAALADALAVAGPDVRARVAILDAIAASGGAGTGRPIATRHRRASRSEAGSSSAAPSGRRRRSSARSRPPPPSLSRPPASGPPRRSAARTLRGATSIASPTCRSTPPTTS